jgi:S1-C subfamily serine protease
VIVHSVVPGSAANLSGLDPGDLILSINGEPIPTIADLRRALRDSPDEMIYVIRNIQTGQRQGMVTRLDR